MQKDHTGDNTRHSTTDSVVTRSWTAPLEAETLTDLLRNPCGLFLGTLMEHMFLLDNNKAQSLQSVCL